MTPDDHVHELGQGEERSLQGLISQDEAEGLSCEYEHLLLLLLYGGVPVFPVLE